MLYVVVYQKIALFVVSNALETNRSVWRVINVQGFALEEEVDAAQPSRFLIVTQVNRSRKPDRSCGFSEDMCGYCILCNFEPVCILLLCRTHSAYFALAVANFEMLL
jgi:hypothetical protein